MRAPTPSGDPNADVVREYLEFAGYAAGDSPCFQDWSRGVAADPEVLGWLSRLPRPKRQPNLVFAAARWHGVPAPAPYAVLRDALLGDDGTISATILARATQTNEVGRLATLLPAFWRVHEESGRPLALLEVGASAGLCLLPDRYRYRWQTSSGTVTLSEGGSPPGVAAAVPPTLDCRVTGPAPLPRSPLPVAWRAGIDLHPLDVTDPDAMAWLAALIWPEQQQRRDRLVAAVAVARTDPPPLVTGDLLDRLPSLLEEAAGHGAVVVFHTAVLLYLSRPDRRRFHAMMTALGRQGRCRWVSNEASDVLPEVVAAADASQEPGFVLGLDGVALARTHGHGAWLHWLG